MPIIEVGVDVDTLIRLDTTAERLGVPIEQACAYALEVLAALDRVANMSKGGEPEIELVDFKPGRTMIVAQEELAA